MQAGQLLQTTTSGQQLYKITILKRPHDYGHKKTLFSSLMQRESCCQHLSVINAKGKRESKQQLLLFALTAAS